MSSVLEETPLLASERHKDHNAIYDRFSKEKYEIETVLAAYTFIPSIPQMAIELNSTGAMISLVVSTSMFATAIGSLTWASYSTYYGRRPVYLWGIPLLCLGSLGMALSRTAPELMAWRFLQAFGCAGGSSVGAGVIGDIYKLEERGTAMGIFFAAILVGPAVAPLVGGLAAHYGSWRYMQFGLFVAGILQFIALFYLFPETMHPNSRGVDEVVERSGGRAWLPNFVWVNPVKSLWILRSPNLMAVTIASTCTLLTDFVLLLPIAYTIGERYHITNEAVIGAFFLPCGIGNCIGAPLAGHISDKIIVKWRKRRSGEWVPEDRLRAALFGGATFVPLSVLLSGLITHFIDGSLGLILNVACIFMNGVGVDLVLSPCAAYGVDIMHSRSAEITAASFGLRAILLSIILTGLLPMINLIGVAATNGLTALIAWMGFGIICFTIRYGDRMRAWVDVGYSTADSN